MLSIHHHQLNQDLKSSLPLPLHFFHFLLSDAHPLSSWLSLSLLLAEQELVFFSIWAFRRQDIHLFSISKLKKSLLSALLEMRVGIHQ